MTKRNLERLQIVVEFKDGLMVTAYVNAWECFSSARDFMNAGAVGFVLQPFGDPDPDLCWVWATDRKPVKIVEVTYGRSIEVGQFGRGRKSGKVWFGFSAAVEDGDNETALAALRDLADAQERIERADFEMRDPG